MVSASFERNGSVLVFYISHLLKTGLSSPGKAAFPGELKRVDETHSQPSALSDLTSCPSLSSLPQYGLKKKEEKEAEEKAALEQPCEGSLTRPKKAIPAGCGDEEEEEEESILDTVLKYLPGPLQDMFKK